MRTITSFVCQECGYESPEWLGKCPECGVWNSLREIKIQNAKVKSLNGEKKEIDVTPKRLKDIKFDKKDRILSGYSEVDGVLGGGIVKGSVILLAGDPGIGKSTLLLQIGLNLAKTGAVLYISGEESEEQIKLRALRLRSGLQPEASAERQVNKNEDGFMLVSNTNIDAIINTIETLKPNLVIVDSIQTMESENVAGLSGSVGQVRYGANVLIRVAKTNAIPIIMVGHVTKEGMVAGPMVLSHMVDTVLFLEGEKFTRNRILRSFKNRFGPIDEVGVFSMEEGGIEEIKNPEQIFLTLPMSGQAKSGLYGSALVVTLEGSRAFLVEVQSLVIASSMPMPRRVASGIDHKRLELLLAVLQKHCRLPLHTTDVFVNVAGGMKISDPASDLGICLAIFSSFKNIPMNKIVAIGEVGLLGELRNVAGIDKRIKEASKLGFKQILSSKNYKTLNEVMNSFNNER